MTVLGFLFDFPFMNYEYFISRAVGLIVFMISFSFVIGSVVQIVYSARFGRRSSFGACLLAVIRAIIPVITLTIAIAVLVLMFLGLSVGMIAALWTVPDTTLSLVLVFLGLFVGVIGGAWIWAVFSVMVPIVVIERAGLGALRRSAALTKEYRWPIVGTLAIVAIINYMLLLASEFVPIPSFPVPPALPEGVDTVLGYAGVTASIVGLGFAYGGIVTALIYARLREIKEGVGIDHIAAVFD